MATTNPLTQVYEAFWTLLEANSGFTSLVSVGNRIKYTGEGRNPEKRGAQASDYPRVRIRESAGKVTLSKSSNSTFYVKQYEIQVATGDQEYTSMHDVEFQILRAMADWYDTMSALQWTVDSSYFAKNCHLLDTRQMLDNKEQNQNIRGWSTVWACTVDMWFNTETLKPT